jgi:hypothetical protein
MNNQVSDTDSGLFIFRYKKTKYNQQIEALVKELKKKIAKANKNVINTFGH